MAKVGMNKWEISFLKEILKSQKKKKYDEEQSMKKNKPIQVWVKCLNASTPFATKMQTP